MSSYRYNDWDEDYVIPYKSKKKKVVKKANHKHRYKKVIGEIMSMKDNMSEHYVIAKQCEICGKVEITDYFITVPVVGKPLKRLTSDIHEIKELYPDLEIIQIQ